MTGLILAGGKSSRMGQDKALLPVGAQRLIEVVIQRVRPYVEGLLIIAHAHNARQLLALPIGNILTDFKPDCGPLMGLYTGLMHSDTPWNLVVPCDMPWIEGRLLEQLLESRHSGVEVVAGLHPENGPQPFPLLCHVKACRRIGDLLDRGERSLHALLRQPAVQLVQIEDPTLWRAFTSLNTLADYARLYDEATLASRS